MASRTSERGFTIVEVMIVLATAGLILMVVFLAIPAVQRNSRNSARKQDVALALQAVSRYELNNSGAFPHQCGGTANPCTNAQTGTPNDYFLRFDKDNLSYYLPEDINLKAATFSDVPALTDSTALDEVDIYNYERCNSNGSGGAVAAGAGFNDVVALFALEPSTGGSQQPQCQQL